MLPTNQNNIIASLFSDHDCIGLNAKMQFVLQRILQYNRHTYSKHFHSLHRAGPGSGQRDHSPDILVLPCLALLSQEDMCHETSHAVHDECD